MYTVSVLSVYTLDHVIKIFCLTVCKQHLINTYIQNDQTYCTSLDLSQ